MELFQVLFGIGHRDVGHWEEALRSVRGVFAGPIVVGAVRVAVELLVGVAEDGHAEAAVEDLGLHAVQIHVLEPLNGVPGAWTAYGIAAFAEFLEVLGWDAGAAQAGWIEGPEWRADEE